MKTYKSDVAVTPRILQLSENVVMAEYIYSYVDGFDAKRALAQAKKERLAGYKKIDDDRVVYPGEKSHVWIYTAYYKKRKPTRRVKR